MATGLLIRDFIKEERDLRFSDSGSIVFTEIEKNAYRLSLTLEITDIDGERYQNRKTLPDNTHLGYVTLFRGSSVTELIAVKFVRQRIFDIINQGIWNYHQATETISLIDRIISEYGLYYHVAHLTITEDTGAIVPLPKGRGLYQLPDQNTEGEQEAWRIQIEDIVDDAVEDSNYRAFPIASPFPDIAKFRADLAASFLFRLEAWYLKNPLVYLVDNPTDTGDETEGEDEFPEPNQGDGDGDGDEFPIPDPVPPGSDPRDFGETLPSGEPPFRGGQCFDFYDVVVEYSDIFMGTPRQVQRALRVLGPILGLGPFSSTDKELSVLTNSQNYKTGLTNVPFACATSPGLNTNCRARFVSIVRAGGAPDDCGDPPPVVSE